MQGSMILVIDDTPSNLRLLSDYLSDMGFTVLLKKKWSKCVDAVGQTAPGHYSFRHLDARHGWI